MPTRDRRMASIMRHVDRSAAAAPGATALHLAIWRPDAPPDWRASASATGATLAFPSLTDAQELFSAPNATRARRAWALSANPRSDFRFEHVTADDRRVIEWSTALPLEADLAKPGAAPVFATIFHQAATRDARSTDMMSNRRARQVLRKRLEAAIDSGGPSVSAAFGVDNLSELNQTYGFDVADAVLAEVAARIRSVAEQDAADVIVRHLSGSKFGLVATGIDESRAQRLVRKAQNAVAAAPIRTSYGGVAASVSAGLASGIPIEGADAPAVCDQAGEMMARALDVLTSARRNGPSAIKVARGDAEQNMALAERRRLARETMAALEAGRVGLAFQPIVASGSRRPAFHECLARMFAPDGAMVPAGVFVPVIERLGQVRLLDRCMLSAVFDALEDAPRSRLSLNVSTQTLRDAEWLAIYRRRAAAAPRAAERLIVEITESSASGDPAATKEFMTAVRARGAAFALDDFGAGYTAFRQLRDFRFDFLKIDGSFAANIAADSDNRLFLKVMVEIAQHFDMATVAEFVETEAEAEALAALSITYQQGYLHGAPSMELTSSASTHDATANSRAARTMLTA